MPRKYLFPMAQITTPQRMSKSPIKGIASWMATVSLRGLVVGLVSFAAGCGAEEIKWNEQVRLHDGKVVQLKRRTELTGSGFPVQQRGVPKYHEFCYAPLRVHWKSHARYVPEVFDIVGAKAYAKVSISACATCKLHGYPETDALYFVWSGERWTKIDHREFPAQLRLNLLMSPKGRAPSDDARGLITLADKERRDPSIHYSLKATGARGLNELPDRKGACSRCKSVDVMTTEIPDVFLPADRAGCDWPS